MPYGPLRYFRGSEVGDTGPVIHLGFDSAVASRLQKHQASVLHVAYSITASFLRAHIVHGGLKGNYFMSSRDQNER